MRGAAGKPIKTVFVCQSCGAEHPRWAGKCAGCGGWNTLVEEHKTPKTASKSQIFALQNSEPQTVEALLANPLSLPRLSTGLDEVDRVLGGGLVSGSAMLIGGEPGIGKSTLLLQTLLSLSHKGIPCLYISGEESSEQIAHRAARLLGKSTPSLSNLKVVTSSSLDDIVRMIDKEKPSVLVLDSIQTIAHAALDSAPGSVSQVRECGSQLVSLCKDRSIALFLVGHVNKDGMIAGPKVIEHIVDVVISFEGERAHALRTVRCIKNRFGPCDEVGLFEMRAEGLQQVLHPSEMLLAQRSKDAAGSAVAPIVEGHRAMLVEVQALVAPSAFGSARRVTTGIDPQRLAILLAVLHRKTGIQLLDQDVFASIVGGLQTDERGIDLGLALACVSSFRNKPVTLDTAVFGEISLTGEIRPVSHTELRLQELARLGFKRAVIPRGCPGNVTSKKLEIIEISSVSQAVDIIF